MSIISKGRQAMTNSVYSVRAIHKKRRNQNIFYLFAHKIFETNFSAET